MTEPFDDPDFALENLPVEIHCPKCGNEMVHDSNSLPLAESPRGAMLECGTCGEITQWRFTLNPFKLERVQPITWGGHV
jgi:transcription elongation factor Elf1